jgi:hypothetical protein
MGERRSRTALRSRSSAGADPAALRRSLPRVELGEPPHREIWFFADLRGGHEYMSGRPLAAEETPVHGLAIAHQRQSDGSHGSFLLVELDADGDVIDDSVEGDLDEAKAHGEALADAETEGLRWEQVPDTRDVRQYIRQRLSTPPPT